MVLIITSLQCSPETCPAYVKHFSGQCTISLAFLQCFNYVLNFDIPD